MKNTSRPKKRFCNPCPIISQCGRGVGSGAGSWMPFGRRPTLGVGRLRVGHLSEQGGIFFLSSICLSFILGAVKDEKTGNDKRKVRRTISYRSVDKGVACNLVGKMPVARYVGVCWMARQEIFPPSLIEAGKHP